MFSERNYNFSQCCQIQNIESKKHSKITIKKETEYIVSLLNPTVCPIYSTVDAWLSLSDIKLSEPE